ncbi:MAG: trans-aconitate 2-methyltransferase [Candidatus Dormibacteria bacterium]
MYQRSARIYDVLYTGTHIIDFAAQAESLHSLIATRNRAARTLLDVACGTGQHLARLRRWYDVEGLDISRDMLMIARERLGGDVPLGLADMRTFDLGRTFDAVTCLFSSIGYLDDVGQLRRTMQRFAAHLNPGGVLVVDGWVRPDAWKDDTRRAPDYADDGTTAVARLVVNTRRGAITQLDMHHLVHAGDSVEYFAEKHRMRLFATGEYLDAATAAGLSAEILTDYMPDRDRIVAVK